FHHLISGSLTAACQKYSRRYTPHLLTFEKSPTRESFRTRQLCHPCRYSGSKTFFRCLKKPHHAMASTPIHRPGVQPAAIQPAIFLNIETGKAVHDKADYRCLPVKLHKKASRARLHQPENNLFHEKTCG